MQPVRAAGLLRAALRQLTAPPDTATDTEPDTATAELRGRILLSLAYAEAEQGHLELGWRLLDEAEPLLPERFKALVSSQRGLLCMRTGQDDAATDHARTIA